MDSVHLVTQEKFRVEKPGWKPSRVHEHPTSPAREHRPRAQRPGRAPAAPCRGEPCRAPAAACPGRPRAPSACTPVPPAPAACRLCASRAQRPQARAARKPVPPARARACWLPLAPQCPRPSACLCLLRYCAARQRPCRGPSASCWRLLRSAPAQPPCPLVAIQFLYRNTNSQPNPAATVTIQKLYCDALLLPSQPSLSIAIQTLSCNSISPLATLHSLAIHFPFLQYNFFFFTI